MRQDVNISVNISELNRVMVYIPTDCHMGL